VFRTAKSYAEEAVQAADGGNIAHAIWLIENAFSVAGDDITKGKIKVISDTIIPDSGFVSIIRESNIQMGLVSKMLSDRNSLVAEEWMLVVSSLSSTYSLKRFCERSSRHCSIPLLESVMRQLDEATDHFTYGPFQNQLRAARRRYPNPLPAPLS